MIETTVEVLTAEHKWKFDVFLSYKKVAKNIIIKDILIKVNGVFRECPKWLEHLIREQQINELIDACSEEGIKSEQEIL